MKFLIISYKSRNNLFAITQTLKKLGVIVSIINTPRNISISCGLSAKTDVKNLSLVTNIIKQSGMGGFLGAYIISFINGHEQIERVL